MKPSIWRRLDSVARHLVPCGITVLMLLLSTIPLLVTTLQAFTPSLPLIAVFYWTLYKPDLMPAVAVFAIGLLQDCLLGLPIGVSVLVLVCTHAVVSRQRRFFIGKTFGVVWFGFSIVAAPALALGWAITCAYYGDLVAPQQLVFQVLMTIGFFPLLCWALLRCQLSLIEQV